MKTNDEIYGDYQQKQPAVSGHVEPVVMLPLLKRIDKMRDIQEIYSDLVDAEKEVSDECAEIEFHKANRDDAQSYVDQYTKELEDAKLGLVT